MEWTGYINHYGYGQSGRSTLVHRDSWSQKHGPIPDGLCVLHRCDNRRCYNPDHLYLGTRTDNAHWRDRIVPYSPFRKLSWPEVREIRARYMAGGERQVDLASSFGVDQTTISTIVRGQTWKEVPDAC